MGQPSQPTLSALPINMLRIALSHSLIILGTLLLQISAFILDSYIKDLFPPRFQADERCHSGGASEARGGPAPGEVGMRMRYEDEV